MEFWCVNDTRKNVTTFSWKQRAKNFFIFRSSLFPRKSLTLLDVLLDTRVSRQINAHAYRKKLTVHRPVCNQLMVNVCFFRGARICEALGNRSGNRTTPPEFGSGGPDGGPPEGMVTMLPWNQRRLVLLSGFHRNHHLATSSGRSLQGDGGAGQGWQR